MATKKKEAKKGKYVSDSSEIRMWVRKMRDARRKPATFLEKIRCKFSRHSILAPATIYAQGYLCECLCGKNYIQVLTEEQARRLREQGW